MKSTQYIWQSRKWPKFTWDNSRLLNQLGECRRKQGMLLAKIASLGLPYEQLSRSLLAAKPVEFIDNPRDMSIIKPLPCRLAVCFPGSSIRIYLSGQLAGAVATLFDS